MLDRRDERGGRGIVSRLGRSIVPGLDQIEIGRTLGYEGKPFKSVTQGAADLDLIKPRDDAPPQAEDDASSAALIAAIKQALGGRVKDVRSSKRLTESAVCLVNDSEMDRTLEKLLSRQKDSGVAVSAPILEVNTRHPLIKALAASVVAKGPASVSDAAELLLDQAFILEGEQVPDPASFGKRFSDVLTRAFA